MSLILQSQIAQMADAMAEGIQQNMDPFKDSRDNLQQWLGDSGAPASVLSPGAPGRVAGVPFRIGNEQADQRVFSSGRSPLGAGWQTLARSQIGAPYVWAAENPYGPQGGTGAAFDCSGLVGWVIQRATGRTLPHNAAAMAGILPNVGKNQLRPGDALFFDYRGTGIDHVALYLGNGMMIDTEDPSRPVAVRPVDWNAFVKGGAVQGMSGTSGGHKGGKLGHGKGAGAKGDPGSMMPAPLSVPFALGDNYFTAILGPMLNADPTHPSALDPTQRPQLQNSGKPQDLKAYAQQQVLNHGWTLQDYQALVKLWNRESGWDPNAVNQSSGATGIPQLNPNSHAIPQGWYQDPTVQIDWGLRYISQRYGSPSAAWQHSQQTGWY